MRPAITVRDCLGLINGDRRLKDDAAKKSWIRSRLTSSKTTAGNPPPMDLMYVVPYNAKTGLCVAVDSAQNLPKAKLHYAVMRITSEEERKHAEMGGADVFGNSKMDWDGEPAPTGKAPRWVDGFKHILNHAGSNTSALIIEIYCFGEKGKAATVPVAWTMVEVFSDTEDNSSAADRFVVGGKFQVPLYVGAPSAEMITNYVSGQGKGGPSALDRARAQRKIKYADGATVVIRLADGRRGDEMGEDHEVIDLEVPKEKKYTTIAKSKNADALMAKGMNRGNIDAAVDTWMDAVVHQIRK
jgi:hypothetical protein